MEVVGGHANEVARIKETCQALVAAHMEGGRPVTTNPKASVRHRAEVGPFTRIHSTSLLTTCGWTFGTTAFAQDREGCADGHRRCRRFVGARRGIVENILRADIGSLGPQEASSEGPQEAVDTCRSCAMFEHRSRSGERVLHACT